MVSAGDQENHHHGLGRQLGISSSGFSLITSLSGSHFSPVLLLTTALTSGFRGGPGGLWKVFSRIYTICPFCCNSQNSRYMGVQAQIITILHTQGEKKCLMLYIYDPLSQLQDQFQWQAQFLPFPRQKVRRTKFNVVLQQIFRFIFKTEPLESVDFFLSMLE